MPAGLHAMLYIICVRSQSLHIWEKYPKRPNENAINQNSKKSSSDFCQLDSLMRMARILWISLQNKLTVRRLYTNLFVYFPLLHSPVKSSTITTFKLHCLLGWSVRLAAKIYAGFLEKLEATQTALEDNFWEWGYSMINKKKFFKLLCTPLKARRAEALPQ